VIDTDDSSLSAQGWLEDVSKVWMLYLYVGLIAAATAAAAAAQDCLDDVRQVLRPYLAEALTCLVSSNNKKQATAAATPTPAALLWQL
jgi:hypothetical protein